MIFYFLLSGLCVYIDFVQSKEEENRSEGWLYLSDFYSHELWSQWFSHCLYSSCCRSSTWETYRHHDNDDYEDNHRYTQTRMMTASWKRQRRCLCYVLWQRIEILGIMILLFISLSWNPEHEEPWLGNTNSSLSVSVHAYHESDEDTQLIKINGKNCGGRERCKKALKNEYMRINN